MQKYFCYLIWHGRFAIAGKQVTYNNAHTLLSWFVKMKNLFAKISLFQLSDSLVQPQPQGAYVISINKIRSKQKREPHHLTYVSTTLRPRYRYYILKRRISICAWFEFGANKFQDDSRSSGQVLQTHIKQIYTLFRPLYQYTSNPLDDYPILYRKCPNVFGLMAPK